MPLRLYFEEQSGDNFMPMQYVKYDGLLENYVY
jgi:hypothetical protein